MLFHAAKSVFGVTCRSAILQISLPVASSLRPTSSNRELFVLGSGKSIDALQPEQRSRIEASDSWTINYGSMLGLGSTVVFLENFPRSGRDPTSVLLEQEKLPQTIFFSGRPNEREQASLCHAKWSGLSVSFLPRVPVEAQSEEQFASAFPKWLSILRGLNRLLPVALDAGSTVSRVVFLALLHGWESVVLVGFDMGGENFRARQLLFEDSFVSRDNPSADTIHPVDEESRGFRRVSVYLPVLSSAFAAKGYGELLVGTDTGPLAKSLRKFDW